MTTRNFLAATDPYEFVVSGYPADHDRRHGSELHGDRERLSGGVVTTYTGTIHFTSTDPQATAGAGLARQLHLHHRHGRRQRHAHLLRHAQDGRFAVDHRSRHGDQHRRRGAQHHRQPGSRPAAWRLSGFHRRPQSGAAHTFTVTVEDAYGNIATGYTGTVHFTSSDPKATAGNGLPSDYTFTSGTGDDNGAHTFTATLTTDRFAVDHRHRHRQQFDYRHRIQHHRQPRSAQAAWSFRGYPSSTTAGAAHNFTVTIYDTNGNVATGYTGTIHFTSSDSKVTAGNGLPADYTFTTGTGDDNGVHTFSATLKTAGSQSITATDTVNSAHRAAPSPASSSTPQPPAASSSRPIHRRPPPARPTASP